jgi:AraC-like DNA-binding protein
MSRGSSNVSGYDFSSASFSTNAARFSTEGIPEKDRLGRLCEQYGRTVLRGDIKVAEGAAFEAQVESHTTPELRLLSTTFSPAQVTWNSANVATCSDDVALFVNRTSTIAVTSRGRDVILRPGEGILTSTVEVRTFERIATGEAFALHVPRSALAALVNVDDAIMKSIPRESIALRLLTVYGSAVMKEKTLATLPLRPLATAHLHELLALALEAPRDAAALAQSGGVKAARLQEAKNFIIANIARQDLSIGSAALQLAMTPRYLQRLFETEATTFSSFLLDLRLKRAHQMLCHPQFADRSVSAIAYEAGFGDLSYFNRCFRRVYGVTPSDVRNIGAGGAT